MSETTGKRSRILALLALGLLTLAGALAAVFYFAMQGSPRTLVLTDGSHLTVVGTTLGGKFFTTEKGWQRFMRRVLPARWQSWLPQYYSSPTPGEPSTFTLWFMLTDAKGTNLFMATWDSCFSVAEDGSRFPTVVGPRGYPARTIAAGRSPAAPVPPRWVQSVRCEVFPRRQPEFELQFVSRTGKVLGSLRVRNPFRGPFPEWTPEPLPVTRTNGPLTVTLMKVFKTPRALASPVTLVRQSKVESTESRWRHAEEVTALWSDATGNTSRSAALPETALPETEHAWKLDLWYRTAAQTNGGEKFVLSALSVPGVTQLRVLTNEFGTEDWKLKIRCLAGVGVLVLTNNNQFGIYSNALMSSINRNLLGQNIRGVWYNQQSAFLIELRPSWLVGQFHFRVLDSSGRALQVAPNQSGTAGQNGAAELSLLQFPPPRGTNTVTLEVTVNPMRRFEFLVNPKQVQNLIDP